MFTFPIGGLMHGGQELCYLPVWPIGFPRDKYARGKTNDTESNRTRPKPQGIREKWIARMFEWVHHPDEWIGPQTKCIRHVAPYGF